ncbi:PGC-1 and ERR-induced regulator in muscle protein 1 [Pteropus medius]|uniref:PGC-1 and ERR-induced regulator in muscle protein 1 n=1 Tax=Pteropus vampyrus TaxID=132908 RepID=UPI00196B9427|nr:PGC-1 and ERR-induced regulator in muscle protein 1 [Pteropus giganteus]
MENFQYSVQLSDKDWAEFSATAEECGLLQAGLASGDELLSSDIDQGDSSGSSPPGPLTLLEGRPAPGGRGRPGSEEEDQAARQQLVSRSWQEPDLAQGTGQQMPSTSARSASQQSLSPGTSPLGHSPSLLGPVTSRDEMQRLLQGPAPRDPPASPPGEPPRSPESPGTSPVPPRSPGSPGAPPRSPSRKKRRAAGAKGGGRLGTAGSTLAQQSSPQLSEPRPREGLVPAGARGKGLSAGAAGQAAGQTVGAGQAELGPEPAGAPEQVAGPGPGLDLSTPVPTTERGPDLLRTTPRTELRSAPTPAQEALPKSDTTLTALAAKPQPDTTLSTPAHEPQPDTPVSAPTCEPRTDVDPPALGLMVQPEGNSSAPTWKGQADAGTAGPALVPQAGPDTTEPGIAPTARLDLSSTVSSGGHRVKPRGEPPAGPPGHHLGETPTGPVQAPKKKKVRFSSAVPSPEEPGAGRASGPPTLATAWPSAPRTVAGGRGGPGAWDAVAVGPRPPQPRILKHLPSPVPSASGGPEYKSCFAVTVPEAYEFFFCDTIVEEDEQAEEEAEASQSLAEVQWPDVCEFFFRDRRAQRLGRHSGRCPAPDPPAQPRPAPLPRDPMPISIPEAYEHFLGEDKLQGVLDPATLLRLQAAETPRLEPQGKAPGTPTEPSAATAEQLDLAVRPAGGSLGPLTSFTFSQNDMCLVFVAFATWAVRTSDLHTPDAWKTVLLANIGTISAIRYFRRHVGRGRPSPSPSPSPWDPGLA